jgi:hypothetical protein
MLLILRLASLLNYLATTIAATALADPMCAHQLIARRAGNQCRRVEALMLPAIATAMARNFCFWCGTHCCILNPFSAFVVVVCAADFARPHKPAFNLVNFSER